MTIHRIIAAAAGLLSLAACSTSSTSAGGGPSPAMNMSTSAPNPDPRVGLRAGTYDSATRRITSPAAEAAWNMRLVSNTPQPDRFVGAYDSDISFRDKYVLQGNYNGYMVWDISNPAKPNLASYYYCPASQSDVSVYRNLFFISAEAPTARLDCGGQGFATTDSVSRDRIRGIRIFDATDPLHPKYLANVQTCRGSHTHTVVNDLNDTQNIYIYISGNAQIRSASELEGCSALAPEQDPNAEAFKIEVIQVPLANPAQSHVVNKAPILMDLAQAPRNTERQAYDSTMSAASGRGGGRGGGRGRGGAPADSAAAGRGRGGGRGAPNPLLANRGPQQCHDITVYPAIGLAGGACAGYGVLVDVKNPASPRRVGAVADSNFSFWHSATFNNDGTKVIFTDEWGGGTQPRCRSTDKYEWGADAVFTLANNQMTFKSYYKMPAAQTSQENCVAHNGSLIPIPGRDVMVQGWYQGGVSVFDFTDPSHVREIAFFDRGPIDANRMITGGSWSAYWYNGYIVSSEIARGLDIFELVPSGFVSRNELDAAKTVHADYSNVQDQQKIVWPASFSLSRAYLDQLERNTGQTAEKIASARAGLAAAEALSGAARKDALAKLATQLHADANGAMDAPKAHKLAFSVGDLANATR